jgi:hypothetical protein
MEVPPAGDPVWADVLTGKVRYKLDFFAAKILLGWLLLKVENDPSDDVLVASAQALQHLFAQNSGLPCVQRDLVEIFGTGIPDTDLLESEKEGLE